MDVTEQLDQDGTEEAEAPDYGPKFLKLPPDKIDQLQSLVNKLNLRDQWGRQIEIIRCALKRYFWLGLQHTWWNNDTASMQVGPQGGAVVAENFNDEDGTAMQDFNIYKPNGKIFISVFAQNPAEVRMEPDQPGEPKSIRAAAEAEKYIRVYDKYNPPKDAQILVGRLLWNDGRVISITEASDDGQSETTEYAGVLETKVPIYETDFKLWPYAKCSKDHDILSMKSKHSEVADKLVTGAKSASPNDEIARINRISTAESITQLSHDTLQYLVTEDRWWLRPSAFNDMEPEDRAFWIGGEVGEGEQAQQVEGVFPSGCKLTFCGSVFCGAEAVSMDDRLAVMHAEPGEGQARNSLGDPHVPVQMEFNDGMNLTAELLKFCVPSMWADIDEVEFAAIKEQLAQYGQVRPKKRKPGEPMSNDFYPEPGIEAPAILGIWLENLQGTLTQVVTGNQPAMWGGNMEDQKTAASYKQAKDMSLGLLTIVWVPFSTFCAKIHEQAAKIAATRPKPFAALVYDRKKKQETLQIDPSTLNGGFTCSAIVDQGFPESWTTKSQTWKELKAASLQDPSLAADMNLPDNKVGFRDATGLPDFVIQGADSRDKQLEEWAEMQAGEGPEPDEQATQQRDQQAQQAVTTLTGGGPGPQLPQLPPVMKSSIPVDSEADDHVAEGMEMFKILNSPEGQKLKKTRFLKAPNPMDPNDKGVTGEMIWQDGKLHMMAHVAAGQAKGLMFPPPLGGPPPMPMAMPHKAGGSPGAPPPGPTPNPASLSAPPGGLPNAPTA